MLLHYSSFLAPPRPYILPASIPLGGASRGCLASRGRLRCHVAANGGSSGEAGGQGKKGKDKTPMQQRVLNGILGLSNVPYSSYVPTPATALHAVDARIKLLWLVAIYFMIARSTPILRLSIAGCIGLASMLVFPRRLWVAQLGPLTAFSLFILAMTALGADGVPPVLQPRAPTAVLEGLPPLEATGYNYVILHVWFITITQRSVNVAITAASLTFSALQLATLCLVTTPSEEMALAIRWWLTPLRIFRAPTEEICMMLLLSLRFMSLVFEEVRNLCLGVAARGIDWGKQGGRGSLQMLGRLCVRLFGNLFERSDKISQAMMVRGFQGPKDHQLYLMKINKTSWLANTIAFLLLGVYAAVIVYFK